MSVSVQCYHVVLVKYKKIALYTYISVHYSKGPSYMNV